MTEPRRIVGTESSVRVDAQVSADYVSPGAQIPITYEISNQRPRAIAVADQIPETTFDAESRTFTVNIGAEVPGNTMLPRLIVIEPGEKKAFSTLARVIYTSPRSADPRLNAAPAAFRLKVNFLSDTEPFRELIGISQVAIADAKLADALFPLWLERNEVVYTNSIPMRWAPRTQNIMAPEMRTAPSRRRGGN
jgi:hypothetical protein